MSSLGFTNCSCPHLLISELRHCCCLPLQLKKLLFHPSPLHGRGEPGRARAGQVARLIWKGTSLIPTIRKRQLPASQGQPSLIRVKKEEKEEETSLFWRRDIPPQMPSSGEATKARASSQGKGMRLVSIYCSAARYRECRGRERSLEVIKDK